MIPHLEPGQSFELELVVETGPGDHALGLLADPEGRMEDAFHGNNALHLILTGAMPD